MTPEGRGDFFPKVNYDQAPASWSGRRQTRKFRPFMRTTTTWRQWLEPITSGPIVSYAGQPVKTLASASKYRAHFACKIEIFGQ
jgi:hypothetical protein